MPIAMAWIPKRNKMHIRWDCHTSIRNVFTARSLGQGNVFTRICHSVHGGGGVLCPGAGVSQPWILCPGGGGLCPGVLCPGGLCPGGLYPGVYVQAVSFQGVPCLGVRDPPMVKSRQYASHWNAFMFFSMCLNVLFLFITIKLENLF